MERNGSENKKKYSDGHCEGPSHSARGYWNIQENQVGILFIYSIWQCSL